MTGIDGGLSDLCTASYPQTDGEAVPWLATMGCDIWSRRSLDHQWQSLRDASISESGGDQTGGLVGQGGQEPWTLELMDSQRGAGGFPELRQRDRAGGVCHAIGQDIAGPSLSPVEACALALMLPPSVSNSLVPVRYQPVILSLRDPNARKEEYPLIVFEIPRASPTKYHPDSQATPKFTSMPGRASRAWARYEVTADHVSP